MRLKTISNAAVVIAAATFGISAAHAQWSVVSLHPLRSEASNIRAGVGGQQYGTSKPSGGSIHAALWDSTAASHIDLNPLNSSTSFVFDARGSTQVGVAVFGGTAQAGYWTGSAGSWTSIHPAGASRSSANSIRNGVIGGEVESDMGVRRATMWSGPGFATRTDLHPAGVDDSIVSAIDGSNQFGLVSTNSNVSAAMWSGSAASYVNLNPAVASASRIDRAEGGRQVGFAVVNGDRRASMWSGSVASWIDLAPSGVTFSQALAIDGNLQAGFIGLNGDVMSGYRASIWRGSAGSWEDLSAYLVGNWGESQAFAAWNDGATQFVGGFGRNLSTGEVEALLWSQPIPSPGAASLLALGSLVASHRRRAG